MVNKMISSAFPVAQPLPTLITVTLMEMYSEHMQLKVKPVFPTTNLKAAQIPHFWIPKEVMCFSKLLSGQSCH